MSPEAEMYEAIQRLRVEYGFEGLIAIPRDGFLELQILLLPAHKRGRGVGTRFMTELCREADRLRIVLAAYPDSTNAEMKRRLQRWYERFGFVSSDDDEPYRGRHVRMPRPHDAL